MAQTQPITDIIATAIANYHTHLEHADAILEEWIKTLDHVPKNVDLHAYITRRKSELQVQLDTVTASGKIYVQSNHAKQLVNKHRRETWGLSLFGETMEDRRHAQRMIVSDYVSSVLQRMVFVDFIEVETAKPYEASRSTFGKMQEITSGEHLMFVSFNTAEDAMLFKLGQDNA